MTTPNPFCECGGDCPGFPDWLGADEYDFLVRAAAREGDGQVMYRMLRSEIIRRVNDWKQSGRIRPLCNVYGPTRAAPNQ